MEALDLVAMRVAQRQAARPNREIGDTIPLREVMAELAAALRVGERTVSTWLGDGSALVTTYPTTLDALREGRIDERHASAIIDGGRADAVYGVDGSARPVLTLVGEVIAVKHVSTPV